MKQLYAFKSREIAEELRRQGEAGLRGGHEGNHATGNEIKIVKLTEDVAPSGTTEEDSVEGPYTANEQFFGPDSLVLTEEGTPIEMDVYNFSKVSYSTDDIVVVTRWREAWVITSSEPKSNQWIQFRLKSGWNASESGVGLGSGTGISTATILASSDNANMPAGSEVRVYDYKKLFQCAVGSDEHTDGSGGSIGWATSVNLPNGDKHFLVTQCTQKINKYKCTFENGSCTGLFGESVTVTPKEPLSSWPYIDPHPYITGGTSNIEAINIHGLAANSKTQTRHLYIEFEQSPSPSQDPTNSTVPYSAGVGPDDGRWVITDVEEPVAQYITCSWNGATWDYSGELDVYDGFKPEDEYTVEIAHPSNLKVLGEASFGGPCLEVGTNGVARIDRTASTGGTIKYFVIMTSSSLAGEAQEAAVVGTLTPSNSNPPTAEMLVGVNECNVEYKRIGKAFIFGSPGASGDCELNEQDVTQPFVGFDTLEVVETIVDVEGELRMQKKLIKVCSAQSLPSQALPTTSQDVITEVYCGPNGVEKSYRTLNFIGSSTGGADGVELPCTDPNLYDWQYIFENHVYPYPWSNVSYYDITWPEGCEPCPTGCCEQTLLSGSVVYKELTSGDCTASVDSNPVFDTDVVSVQWTAGDCAETPCNCCKTTDGTGFVTYQTGLTAAECAALVTDPPTGSGSDIVSAECLKECPPEPTGCCYVSEGDYRPNKTETECVTGLGGIWSEGEDCPEVGCCTINLTAGGTIETLTTQYLCDNIEFIGDYEGQAVDTTSYAGDGTTCAAYSCDGGVISNFQMSGLSNSGGGCSAGFTQVGTATVINGVATLNVTWTGFDGSAQGASNTLTLTTDGTNWSWDSDIAWLPEVNVVGFDAGAGCASGSGGATSPGGAAFPCDGTWASGTWSFTFTPA